jgi:S1-C subfamily serine protease
MADAGRHPAAAVPAAAGTATVWGSRRHSSGTAFAVSPGLLVTNAHVIIGCGAADFPITVTAYPGPWRIEREDLNLDLVLLRGPVQAAIPPLPISAATRVSHDTLVMAIGYQVDGTPSETVVPYAVVGPVRQAAIMVHRPETGQVASFRTTDRAGRNADPTWKDGLAFFGSARAGSMRWALEIAVRMGHGASGGPVVDRSGDVVGVVVANGMSDGMTSAIPLSDLIEFLAASGVIPEFAPPGVNGSDDWTSVYRRVAPSVVHIGC